MKRQVIVSPLTVIVSLLIQVFAIRVSKHASLPVPRTWKQMSDDRLAARTLPARRQLRSKGPPRAR